MLYVHRVQGLPPGLYLLLRDPERLERLKAAMEDRCARMSPEGIPDGLPLYCLAESDVRGTAAGLSCGQAIAGEGCFAVSMIADFLPTLKRSGPGFYRHLHWEAGAIGQVLYLEAEACGIRATGIGCFFDAETHRLLGLSSMDFQDIYHFTVGGPVADTRLETLPPYAHRED